MYDTFSSDYDRFVNWESRLAFEIPFILQSFSVLERPSAGPIRILDAACGTGWHAIDLARRGYLASGADLSEGMVEKARQNAMNQGVKAHFEAAGFGQLAAAFKNSLAFPFDALLCLGNSLPHLTEPGSLPAALSDFRACLRPGALLLIQNRNFDAVMRDQQRWMEPQAAHEGDHEWLFLRFYDYLPGDLIDFNIVSMQRNGMGGWQQQVHTTRLRPILQTDLMEALVSAGFESVTAYGSMKGEPFNTSSSGNLIVLARAAG